MARRRSPLKLPASAFVLAALFVVALQLQGPLAVAARSVPFSEGDGSEDLESLLRIRGGSKAQAQREGSQGYTDVCGGLEGEESVHEPCFAPNGEVQFCCLSGRTGCACPPWIISSGYTDFGCYNYEHENTLNAISGNECGYFLPASTPSRATGDRMALQVGNVTLNAIAVTRKSDNVFIGYVKRDVNVQGIYGLTTDPSLALSVQDVPTGDGQLVKTLNGHYDNTYPFLGFAANNADLSTMNTNNAFMVSTAYTEPNSPPVAVGNGYSYPGSSAPYSEASIWSRAAGSNVITPTWTDMESHPVSPTVLSLLVSANDFAIAGKPLTGSFFNGEEVIFAIV